MGHVDGTSTDGQHGQHVGFHRVSDHGEFCGIDPVAVQHVTVGRAVFFGDHLDTPEPVGQPASLDLAQLVSQVSLGDQQQSVGGT